ncbi:MAG: hypothetical protein HY811_00075 [Planctomycetes bacterium]|nr:hypothetical protein [Planctomycetota bacterium]
MLARKLQSIKLESTRSWQRIIVILCVLLAAFAGCGKKPEDKTYGGTLKLGGLGGKPSIINPILTHRTVSAAVEELIFNRLIRMNKQMIPQPDLAERWEISDDGLTYIFHLRKGVKFHDGIELTADDCKFTYEQVINPENASPWMSYHTDIKELSAPDRYTFKITLKEPKASYLSLLWIPIAPKHLLEGRDIKTAEFNHRPVGTGPFRFSYWLGNNIVLEANPDYHEGRPYLDKIIATGYDDMGEYWSAFMRGDNDVAFFLSREQFETAKRDAAFRTYTTPAYTYGLEYNPEHPALRDKAVRQAIGLGINVQEIIDKVEGGLGTPSTGPFLSGTWFCNPEVKPPEYNPALCVKLLNQAGWELNKNGIMEKDGKEFRFTMLVNDGLRKGEIISRFIYNDLYKLGIRVDIKRFELKEREKEPAKHLAENAGAFLTAFNSMPDPGDLTRDWHSKKSNRVQKLWTYNNPDVDRLFEAGQLTNGIKERQKIYREIHSFMADDYPVTFLYFLQLLGAVNNKFMNTGDLFSPGWCFWAIKDWKVSSKELMNERTGEP